jgi:hypothetical protein
VARIGVSPSPEDDTVAAHAPHRRPRDGNGGMRHPRARHLGRATTPITGRFPFQDHFVDEGASAACGFPVTADVTGIRTIQVLFDRSGTPIRLQVHINGTGTMSANGIALQESDHVTEFIDLVSGNETDVGLVFREVLPGLGIVIMDRGRVTIAPDGSSVLFVAGPHPALDGDFGSLCAALTP